VRQMFPEKSPRAKKGKHSSSQRVPGRVRYAEAKREMEKSGKILRDKNGGGRLVESRYSAVSRTYPGNQRESLILKSIRRGKSERVRNKL